MALRKYKQKAVEAEPAPVAEDGLLSAPEPSASAEAKPVVSAPVDDNASLRDQLATMRLANRPIEERINEIPNLSVAQRAWLRSRPHGLERPDILSFAHHLALQNNIPVDSAGYFHIMDEALRHHGAFGGALTPPPAPQAEQPKASVDIDMTTKPDDEPDAAIYSAPPSRGDNASNGTAHFDNPSRITLNAAQREAARAAGVDELVYAKNLLKLGKMKKAGLIRD